MKTALEDRTQNRETARRFSFGPVSTGTVTAPAAGATLTVGDVVTRPNAMSLPAWFTSAQACAVLRLKGQSFALFTDACGGVRVASLARLGAAPAEQALVCSSAPLGPRVAPATPLADALQVMDAQRVDHVTVARGGVMIGVLGRPEAERGLALDARHAQPAAASSERFAA